MLVRAPTLAASMSRYLIDRIAAYCELELLTRTEITDVSGSRQCGVESVAWHGDVAGQIIAAHHVFLFPRRRSEHRMAEELRRRSGREGLRHDRAGRVAAIANQRPWVFAIGDVRAGSVKAAS